MARFGSRPTTFAAMTAITFGVRSIPLPPSSSRYGARLPASVDEVRAINAAGSALPFHASGNFAGEYPSASNHDRLVARHNEILSGIELPDGVAYGHLKDLLADGALYHPDQGLQGAHRSNPAYVDYSQGIRLVRDTAPDMPTRTPSPHPRAVAAPPDTGLIPAGRPPRRGVDGGLSAPRALPRGPGLSAPRALPRGPGLSPRRAAGPDRAGLGDDRAGPGDDLLALGRMWFSGAMG
jgi:hypothetical protein